MEFGAAMRYLQAVSEYSECIVCDVQMGMSPLKKSLHLHGSISGWLIKKDGCRSGINYRRRPTV